MYKKKGKTTGKQKCSKCKRQQLFVLGGDGSIHFSNRKAKDIKFLKRCVLIQYLAKKKNVRIIREKNRVILQTPSSWKFQSILILLLHKKYCLTFRNVFQKKKKYRYRSNFLLKLFKYIIKEVVRA